MLPVVGVAMSAPLDRDFRPGSNGAVVWHPGKLWSLLDMLHSYFPIYQIALDLEALRGTVQTLKEHSRYTSKPSEVTESIAKDFTTLLKTIHQRCLEYGLIDTSDMAKRLLDGVAPDTYFYCVINAIWLQVVGASTDSMDIARGILRARR
jgi:hypothetical protein